MKNKIKILISFFLISYFGNAQNDVYDVARKGSKIEIELIFEKDNKLVSQTNTAGFTPLILACYNGNFDVAAFLIKKKVTLDYVSKMGTALTAATFKGDAQLVQLLLENGANANLTDENGTTPLIYAVIAKNKEIVELLVRANAKVELVDSKNLTALDYATMAKQTEILNLLKENKN